MIYSGAIYITHRYGREALYVSAELFPMLGVNAALGRCFLPREDRRMQPSLVVVLSHSLWQRRFGASRDAISQSLTLDGTAYTVIGARRALRVDPMIALRND